MIQISAGKSDKTIREWRTYFVEAVRLHRDIADRKVKMCEGNGRVWLEVIDE